MTVEEGRRSLSAVDTENPRCRLAPVSTEDSGINRSVLLVNCLGNPAFAVSLLEEFEATGLGHVCSMMMHSQANNFTEVSQSAHSLRSSAAIVGASRLSKIATSVEYLAHSSNRHQLRMQLTELDQEMQNCLDQISRLRLTVGD